VRVRKDVAILRVHKVVTLLALLFAHNADKFHRD